MRLLLCMFVQLPRARRFPSEYNFALSSLVGTFILHIWEDHKTTQARVTLSICPSIVPSMIIIT